MKFNILPGREGFGTGYTSKRTKVKLYKKQLYTLHQTAYFLHCVRRLCRSFGQFLCRLSFFRFHNFLIHHYYLLEAVIVRKSMSPYSLYWLIPISLISLKYPVVSRHQTSIDFKLPDIYGLQASRHLWTAGYQVSGDSRLPDIYGLQATRHPGTPDYQTSVDCRLPGIQGNF